MNEDEKFNAMVKVSLEDGIQVGADVLASITSAARREVRRRRVVRLVWCWVPVSFLAASIALVAVIGTTIRSEAETKVTEAIDLLRVLDGELGDYNVKNVVESLLAWQDAPCGFDPLDTHY